MNHKERTFADARGAGDSATAQVSKTVNEDTGEREPLLGNRNTGESLSGNEDVEDSHIKVTKPNNLRNCRSLVLLAVLWLIMLFISAAYSLIAPFFPNEVIILNLVRE